MDITLGKPLPDPWVLKTPLCKERVGDHRRGTHWYQVSSGYLSKLEEVLSSAMLFLKPNGKG